MRSSLPDLPVYINNGLVSVAEAAGVGLCPAAKAWSGEEGEEDGEVLHLHPSRDEQLGDPCTVLMTRGPVPGGFAEGHPGESIPWEQGRAGGIAKGKWLFPGGDLSTAHRLCQPQAGKLSCFQPLLLARDPRVKAG